MGMPIYLKNRIKIHGQARLRLSGSVGGGWA